MHRASTRIAFGPVMAQYLENFTGPVKSRYVYFTGPVSQNILAQYRSCVQTLLALYWRAILAQYN